MLHLNSLRQKVQLVKPVPLQEKMPQWSKRLLQAPHRMMTDTMGKGSFLLPQTPLVLIEVTHDF